MHITFDTENAKDIETVQTLVGLLTGGATVQVAKAPAAKKAAAAPKAEAAPPPAPIASDEPTLDDAVALATELVSDGKSLAVKAVITKFGASRVSLVPADEIPALVAALEPIKDIKAGDQAAIDAFIASQQPDVV